jgi:hypothetical protein
MILTHKVSVEAIVKEFVEILPPYVLDLFVFHYESLFSKMLTNRLAPKLVELVHPSQSTFIRTGSFKIISSLDKLRQRYSMQGNNLVSS